MSHNKISFTREYCNCRRIPYKIKGEALFINGYQICYSLYNLTYKDIIEMIDNVCYYNSVTTYFDYLVISDNIMIK